MVSSCSSSKVEDRIFTENEIFNQGFTGLAVFDLEANRMIYEKNSHKYFTPASNIKLFTFYTGLKILGDSIPAIKYVVRQDSLIFRGTGDPSFLNPEYSSSRIYKFLQEREEKLYYLLPSFQEKFFGPGWAWDDYNDSYAVERTAFPVYGNRVSFKFIPGATPLSHPALFRDSISLSPSKNSRPLITRDLERNRFSYATGLKQERTTQSIPIKFSHELLAGLLADTLNREIRILKDPPAGFQNAATLYSIPADSLYKNMLEKSDNFIAEQVLLLSAGKIADSLKTDIAIQYMLSNFLHDLPDKVKWVDGSGLSRYNLITPRTVIGLLIKIKEEVPQQRLFNLLATGGVSGTLRDGYKNDQPFLFAKTGTLRNNHSLSGYIRARSGKILAFSFMNSNYVVPTSEIKKQMEIILRRFHEEN